jgi:PAS domain S-box-containing protein
MDCAVGAGMTAGRSPPLFALVADAAPVMLWQSAPDRKAIYFNRAWLEFTGRSIEQEAGQGWADGIHPADVDRCLAMHTQAFDARKDFEAEYRLRRHDGEYRWVLDRGRAFHAADGEFLGYIDGCIDITDRKRDEAERQIETLDHALQMFFVIGLVVTGALADLPPTRVVEPPGAALVQVLELASSGTAHVRDAIVAAKRPAMMERGLPQWLHRLARAFEQRTGNAATLVLTGPQAQNAVLPSEVADRLHAVVAEALAYLERDHSKRRTVVLELHIGRRGVSLSVRDDLGFGMRARLPLDGSRPR